MLPAARRTAQLLRAVYDFVRWQLSHAPSRTPGLRHLRLPTHGTTARIFEGLHDDQQVQVCARTCNEQVAMT
jgi:hypothetical protein